MSNFLELCAKRQSCRGFSDKPVEHEKLVSCIEAGRLAPSACNSQPWSFIVVENPNLVAQVATAAQQLGANAFTDKAQAFIIVIEEHAVLMPKIRAFFESQYFAKGDVGAVATYICLEAAAQGLGACQIGLFNREAICKALDIPIEKRLFSIIAIGYPADETIRPKVRKPLEDISRFI